MSTPVPGEPKRPSMEKTPYSPTEQALPFSEAAREAAAFAVYADLYERGDAARREAQAQWAVMVDAGRAPCRAKADRILTAAVNADPRAKALLKLAALTDEELRERVLKDLRAIWPEQMAARTASGDEWGKLAAECAVRALGLPVAEQTP